MAETISQKIGARPQLVIVGSGLFGLTVARLAAERGFKCLILERRSHPGGNAWSELDPETGIEVHKYGSHLFHTSNEKVWAFVNRFSSFNNYQHHVFSRFDNRVFRLPVNLQTINDYFGLDLTPKQARTFLDEQTAAFQATRDLNLEGRAKALVGEALYQAFFKGYTAKQWGVDPSELPAEVISRLPLRTSYDSRYFKDKYEGLPVEGYFGLVNNMLDHPKIDIWLTVDYFDVKSEIDPAVPVVYCGPIDRYFNFSLGELGWRTLDFHWERHAVDDYQGCAVMNYADESVPWTRIHEFRHLHPERNYGESTIISKEFSRISSGVDDEPYYPMNALRDRTILDGYRKLASREPNTFFGGRLGTYQYLDMHMAIASAITKFENEILPTLTP